MGTAALTCGQRPLPVSLPSRKTRSSRQAHPGGRYGVVALAFSPDGKTLATGGYTSETYLWNTVRRTVIAVLTDLGANRGSVDIQADQFGSTSTLAAGDTTGAAYLWTSS